MNRTICRYLLVLLFCTVVIHAEEPDGYSYTGLDGVLLSSNDTWYYEEYDPLGRPVTGIRWENGTIVTETIWFYHGDSQHLYRSVTTDQHGIIETEYDQHGNILLVRETAKADNDPAAPDSADEPDASRILEYAYDENNRLRKSVRKEGLLIVTILFEYHEDGSLAEKRKLRNGSLTVRTVYRDEENWTETVYHDEEPLLTVVYENGQRKRMNYETP